MNLSHRIILLFSCTTVGAFVAGLIRKLSHPQRSLESGINMMDSALTGLIGGFIIALILIVSLKDRQVAVLSGVSFAAFLVIVFYVALSIWAN
ncbi:MAG: hypothetical protein KDE62_11625 [Calditrichaeota bacterium]|nr:hypothetical protein [Calditrichota bacterium]MCB0293912.1 hypothetical protein [Calditrichota bacterium]